MANTRLAGAMRGPRLDRFDLLLLVVVAALSLWTLGLDLWQVAVNGRVWTGTEAVYQEDGMQSLMWLRGILQHGASPDLYVLAHTSADFFQPLLAVSAGVAALGVAPYVALLLWKPVALLAIFFVTRAYVYRLIPGRWPRRAALTLALLYGWGQVIGDSWIVFWSWGYPFALIALACTLGALLAYSRARAAGRVSAAAALLGMLASWLHPWQGETLILIVVGAELALLARRRSAVTDSPAAIGGSAATDGRAATDGPTAATGGQAASALPPAIRRPADLAAPALTVALTALPLLYFALLVHFDPVWQREREAALSTYPVGHVVSGFILLALPALLAYRTRVSSFLELTARVWPAATVAIFALSEWQGSGSTHALLGVTIPLGVLAVQGVCTLPWPAVRARLRDGGRRSLPALTVVAIAVVIVPGTLYMLKYAQRLVKPRSGNANFIAAGESRALAYLERDPHSGGVLTRFYLGMVVPAQTGRKVYTGNCYWSEPACRYRSVSAEKLLTGEMSATRARAFVRSTGARYVLGDCESQNLTETLAPMLAFVRHFGCAAVYVID
ncbi:MAG TPA: hypothetical protein VNV42_15215 [Solirubrobacteraceae bacterium]|jgi:hypothetical protein|nr:hypothetical protein [Solirubrobacteraceae bacterium]